MVRSGRAGYFDGYAINGSRSFPGKMGTGPWGTFRIKPAVLQRVAGWAVAESILGERPREPGNRDGDECRGRV